MKSKNYLFALFIVLLCSCNDPFITTDFYGFYTDYRWQKSDVKIFKFKIEDETKPHDLQFRFRHMYDYQFAEVPINFVIKSPDGKKEAINIQLPIRSLTGENYGDCDMDICDNFYVIKSNTKFKKGTYEVIVSHTFPWPYLPNMIGIGLDLDKSK